MHFANLNPRSHTEYLVYAYQYLMLIKDKLGSKTCFLRVSDWTSSAEHCPIVLLFLPGQILSYSVDASSGSCSAVLC